MPPYTYEAPLADLELAQLPIAVFDLETTGLFPARDHIIQIALVPVADAQLEPGAQEWKVNPGNDVPIPQFILHLTHISIDDIRAAPPIEQVLPQFGDAVGARVVAGHNVKSFDLPFVRRAERRVGIDVQTDYYIDTLRLARKLKPNQPDHKLATCAAEYAISFDPDALHDALADTRLCAQLLLAQIADLAASSVVTFGDMLDFLR